MNLSGLTSKQTKEITKLLEKREALQRDLDNVESQLKGYESSKSVSTGRRPGRPAGRSGPGRPGRPPGKAARKGARKTTRKAARKGGARKRAGRGQLKERILGELRNAGKDGITVKEIAKRLNAKPANIHAWFVSTGKRMKEIKKIGMGQYRLEE